VESADDGRAASIIQADREAAERRERARAALEEANAQLDEGRFEEVISSLRRLRTATQDLRIWILETGRELLRLEQLAGPGGYKALVRAGLVSIPENRAAELRQVARAVAEGRLEATLLPSAVKPAYELARLEPPVLTLVAERVQLGPETTVREIRQAAAAVRAEAAVRKPTDVPRLEERLRQLEKRRDAEIERVRQRYAKEIEATRAELEALIPKRRGRGQHAA